MGRWLRLGLLLLVGLAPASGFSQYTTNGTLYTIQYTGPISNRLNVVIFAEGYTTNDLARHFLADATNEMSLLLDYYEPLQEYQNYCNVYAIAVPSTNSGSTHPQYGLTSSTFFGSSYDLVSDYVITVPTSGLIKMTNLLNNLMPSCGLPIILVNDGKDGGAGGPADVVSVGTGGADIVTHETGHTLGKLQDEYTLDPNSSYYLDLNLSSTVPAPNTCYITNVLPGTTWSATSTNTYKYLTNIAWSAWLTNGTPIPTTSGGAVGLFQGANYSATNWYRPQADCMMRNVGGVDFCPVCREALVKAICQKARPVDSFSPATNTTVTITNTQSVVFTLTQPQPLTHNLATQWYTNGVAIGGATNKTYTLTPTRFTNGNYVLSAQVHDPTAFVRSDPSNYLSATVAWNLNVNVYQLSVSGLGAPKGSTQFHFRLTGNAPYGFIIQGATNLIPTNGSNWYPVSTNFLTNGQFYFTNRLTNLPRQFFRARILP